MSAVSFHQDPRVLRQFVAFSRVVGVLLIVAALAVLVHWLFSARLPPALAGAERPPMKANTAIGFLLSGVALLISRSPRPGVRLLGKLLSLGVAALGAAMLAEYVWGVDWGIDHLFDDPYAIRVGRPAGRTSATTCVSLGMLGGLGLLIATRRWLWLREGLAIGLLAIAMAGMTSYGFALAGRGNFLFEHVPILSAVLLMLATLGWMSSVPDTGLTRVATADTFGGLFARRLLLPGLVLPVVYSFLFESIQAWLGMPEAFALLLAALFTGGTLSISIWWVAALLDRVELQRRESAMLRSHAFTDALTGLANRRAFDQALVALLHGRREHDAVFSLLLLDLDRFKDYNDDFGHLAGDEVLRITGRLLRAALRPADLAARYGGEEFALVLPRTDGRQAHEVAQRLLEAFRNHPWPRRRMTVSVGVVEARADDRIGELLDRVDRALYDAKRAGRDRAVQAMDGPATAGMAPHLPT